MFHFKMKRRLQQMYSFVLDKQTENAPKNTKKWKKATPKNHFNAKMAPFSGSHFDRKPSVFAL
ncbi:hypothetical protein [Fluviicola sp.]|uniref:hypothetical protein n=1 Tax=Fluviicola sp. TaxID=1917219 RepID=UPI003D28E244